MRYRLRRRIKDSGRGGLQVVYRGNLVILLDEGFEGSTGWQPRDSSGQLLSMWLCESPSEKKTYLGISWADTPVSEIEIKELSAEDDD